MTPLRQRFIEDMQLRGLAPTTQRSYIHYVAEFAKFYRTSPENLDLEAIRQYGIHLLNERKLSPQSVNTFISSVQFLYTVTLEMPWDKQCFPRVRVGESLPVVLAPEEVARFFDCVTGLKYRAALMLCYGAGLRIAEAAAVKISDIDSKRMLIRVEQGKGKKDRYAMLSPRLLALLRCYWRADEFQRRFLIHTLPAGFQRIRHYGFLANCHRKDKLELCRALLIVPIAELLPQPADCAQMKEEITEKEAIHRCPHCGIGSMIRAAVLPCYRWPAVPPPDTS